MQFRQPPLLDMTPQGEFRTPGFRLGWPMRVGLVAMGVSLVAGVVAMGALLIYLALILIPVAIVAGAVAYVALRLQVRRAGSGKAVFRP
jgi:predicted branched-subunit amino acid permease